MLSMSFDSLVSVRERVVGVDAIVRIARTRNI
jgi:hypothetical protein